MSKTYLELLEKSLPDKDHSTYNTWKRYALNAIDRGKDAVAIVKKYTSIGNKKILDIGCGEGGTSIAFAQEGAMVTAIDVDKGRVERTRIRAKEHGVQITTFLCNINNTDFPDGYFDVIVCQDVIEHVLTPEKAVSEIGRILNNNGYLFLTAPNRLSPFNFIRDPHYNLFALSLLPRNIAAFYTSKIRRITNNYNVRNLVTLSWLRMIFSKSDILLQVLLDSEEKIERVVQENSGLKRNILRLFQNRRLTYLLIAIMKQGFYQYFIAPSWRLIGTKNKNIGYE